MMRPTASTPDSVWFNEITAGAMPDEGSTRDPLAAEPVVLAREQGDLLVMYHAASTGGQGGTAVLLCPPFGWQEVSAYRPLRSWGRVLAEAGHAVARVAYTSTGDSAGTPEDPDRLQAWVASVVDSARWLRLASGATRICAIGIGIGGLLATQAAALDEVDDLILWASRARGAPLLRELRAHARIVTAATPSDPETQSEDGVMLVGYWMTSQTAKAIEAIDLRNTRFRGGRPRRALVIGRDGFPADAQLVTLLDEAGFNVEAAVGRHELDGMIGSPEEVVDPTETISDSIDWLAASPLRLTGPPSEPLPSSWAAPVPNRGEHLRIREAGGDVIETPMWFDGPQGDIFGVLTTASTGPGNGPCVVLLSPSAVAHTGPHRSWVYLARAWARLGVSTLRVALAGLGESGGEDPYLRTLDSFYDPVRDQEVDALLTQLSSAGVADRFILGGLCSGAYQALKRALADERVCGLLLINPYTVSWRPYLGAERGRRFALVAGVGELRTRLTDPKRLRSAVAVLRPDRFWRVASASAEREERAEIVTAFKTLHARGITTGLLLGETEAMLPSVEHRRVASLLRTWPEIDLIRIPSRDHMFRSPDAQRFVHAELGRVVQLASSSAPLESSE